MFQGLKATAPGQCGVWPTDLASGDSIDGWKNDSYPNFGCATQATLAAQVADPRDLAQSRASGPGDVAMRLRAIGDVREGKDPGTDWKTKITAIGQVGREIDHARTGSRSSEPSPRPGAIPQIDPVPRVSIQAFCETPETAAIVQTAIADRRMAKTHVKQNMGAPRRRSKPIAARRPPTSSCSRRPPTATF